MKTSIFLFAALLLGAAPAIAQTNQQRARPARHVQTGQQNYAQREAVRLLFGPRGIPALTRPSDPWNFNRPRPYSRRPRYFVSPSRRYYR